MPRKRLNPEKYEITQATEDNSRYVLHRYIYDAQNPNNLVSESYALIDRDVEKIVVRLSTLVPQKEAQVNMKSAFEYFEHKNFISTKKYK